MKILACVPSPQSATSFYRSIGPLQEMARQGVEVTYTEKVSWVNLGFNDVYFHPRPGGVMEMKAIMYAKDMGLKVWVDYDDNLFEVPRSNSNHDTYSLKEVFQSIQVICKAADLVTVSTEPLKRVIEKYSGSTNVHVVRNAQTKYHVNGNFTNPREKQIVWRGGSTHVADLLAYKDQIKEVAQAHKDWSWLFIGPKPWMLDDCFDGVDYYVTSAPDTISYLSLLSRIKSSIGIVPLEFNSFNECKSNIAELEFYGNALETLVPDMSEWKSVNRYTEKTFAEKLDGMITGIDSLKPKGYEFDLIEKTATDRHVLLNQLF